MIITELLIRGFLIGLLMAMSIGPIALLCIQRTLSNGMSVGFAIGLGAAFADSVYGLLAALGLAIVSEYLLHYEGIIAVMGGIFIVYLAVQAMKSKPKEKALSIGVGGVANGANTPTKLLKTVFSSFLLTLSSPMTILLFTSIFTGMDLFNENFETREAFALILGIFLGSTLWWIILSGTIKMIRNKLSEKIIILINRIGGVLLMCFASFSIYRVLVKLIPMG